MGMKTQFHIPKLGCDLYVRASYMRVITVYRIKEFNIILRGKIVIFNFYLKLIARSENDSLCGRGLQVFLCQFGHIGKFGRRGERVPCSSSMKLGLLITIESFAARTPVKVVTCVKTLVVF